MSIQPGAGYNFVTSGGATALTIDPVWQYWGEDDQFQVTVANGASGWQVQCRKGFVRSSVYGKFAPWAKALGQFEVQKFFAFPDGSKTTGDAATAADSPMVDLGGYITIQPASVEGGSDNWGVYIIGCPPDDDSGTFIPLLAIMAEGSDADAKTEPFMAGQTIKHYLLYYTNLQDVDTPTGTVTLTMFNLTGQAIYNYNCQKWKMADLTWDGSTFVVNQTHLGPLALQHPVSFEGWQYVDPAAPPAWFPDPYYLTELQNWNGAWTGYTKDSTGATVEV